MTKPKIVGSDGEPMQATPEAVTSEKPKSEEEILAEIHAMNAKRLSELQTGIDNLAASILHNLPQCRSRAMAITKLEECGMWLLKGVSTMDGMGPRPDQQQPPPAAND